MRFRLKNIAAISILSMHIFFNLEQSMSLAFSSNLLWTVENAAKTVVWTRTDRCVFDDTKTGPKKKPQLRQRQRNETIISLVTLVKRRGAMCCTYFSTYFCTGSRLNNGVKCFEVSTTWCTNLNHGPFSQGDHFGARGTENAARRTKCIVFYYT